MQKKCKQCSRPAKKRAVLSFASASTVKKKSKLNASANSSKPIVNSTIESQSFHGDVNNSNKYTCKSESEPNHAEGEHKSFLHLTQNTLQVIRDDGGWLDDQIIKVSMDILKNQYPMFRGFHNALLGANLTFPVTEPPFIQILHVQNHWITVEAVTTSLVKVHDGVFYSTDISAQMQIASLIRTCKPVIELQIQRTPISSGFFRLWLVFNSLCYRISLWK